MVVTRSSVADGHCQRDAPTERNLDMDWIVLLAAASLEAVWAAALDASNGFRRWKPTVLYAVASLLSLAGLGFAMQTIPTGTAYAVWVGIGAALTMIWSVITKQERLNRMRTALLVILVASVIGLKVVS